MGGRQTTVGTQRRSSPRGFCWCLSGSWRAYPVWPPLPSHRSAQWSPGLSCHVQTEEQAEGSQQTLHLLAPGPGACGLQDCEGQICSPRHFVAAPQTGAGSREGRLAVQEADNPRFGHLTPKTPALSAPVWRSPQPSVPAGPLRTRMELLQTRFFQA